MVYSQGSDSIRVNSKVIYPEKISATCFNSIKYTFPTVADTIPIDKTQVKIFTDSMQIKTKAGILSFINHECGGESSLVYRYINTFSWINYVHLRAYYWESTEDFLINVTNGNLTKICSEPLFSPNRRLAFAFTSGDDLQMELFKVANGEILQVFSTNYSPDYNFEIYAAKWESEDRIVLKIIRYPYNNSDPYDYVRLMIDI
jgi:hypothetical protein